jgi:hypothetical protein
VQLRGPSDNIQKTLNRWPSQHLEIDIALLRRLLDPLEDAQHRRIGEIQFSEVQANMCQTTIEQRLYSLDEFCLVGEVELSLALQYRRTR